MEVCMAYALDLWVRTSCLQVSRCGTYMCLLINSRDDTYVAVIDNTENKIVAMFSHHGCEGFILSHDKEFIVTYSQLGSVF